MITIVRKRKILVVLVMLLSTSLFAQYEKFKPIETSDLPKYFKVQSSDEGPGKDYFGTLLVRLHVITKQNPQPLNEQDAKSLPIILKETGSRFSVSDHNNKFIFEFASNASWKKENASLSLFMNDELIKAYNEEIKDSDEVWLFFIITSFNTFDMAGYGRVVDFLTKEQMIKKNLTKAAD